MIKQCHVCNHTGELTWRDGKYYCAMCGSEVSEKEPQVQPQHKTTTNNATCPICKNRENNLFDGAKYRCALCGTPFDLQAEIQVPIYGQSAGTNISRTQRVQELHKKKDKQLLLGIVFVFLFWPVSIYFFYQYYKIDKELKAIG